MSGSTRGAVRSDSVCPGRLRPVAVVTAVLLGCTLVLTMPSLSTAMANEPSPSSAPQTSTQPTPASTPEATSIATPEATPESTPPATAKPNPKTYKEPATSPQIEGPRNGQFIGSSRTTISGTKGFTQEIQLLSPRGGDPLCTVSDLATTWTCEGIYLRDGPTVTLRVVVSDDPSLTDEITVAVLGAPTVLGGLTGSDSNGWVRGTGHPQATVTASLPNGETCTGTADNSGAWACLFTGTEATGRLDVTASQVTPFSTPSSSNISEPVAVVFDLETPAPPVLTTPRNGAQVPLAGTEYSGTGESASTVTVFAGPYSVCSAAVKNDSTWRCAAGGVAAGDYAVVAVQQDPAGNVSAGSARVMVSYVTHSATATPPAGSASATPPVVATPSGSESSTPDGSIIAPGLPSEPMPPSPSASATATVPNADPSVAPAAAVFSGRWNDPTPFALALGASNKTTPFPWLQAAGLALGALLLFVIPLRMLAGLLAHRRGSRPPWRLPSLTGRNRRRVEPDMAPTGFLHRWLRGCAALVAGAAFIMLSGPVIDQPAYLRLFVAVIVGLALVNAVALFVPLWWASRILRRSASIRFLPHYLLFVAVAAIASRVFDVHPAVLFGVLGSATLAAQSSTPGQPDQQPNTTQRGQLAAVRVGSLVALAVVAWSLRLVLPVATDFTTSLAAETVNTIVLAATGSAALILLPIGYTSGRSLLAWSPLAWTGLTLGAYGLWFAALAPVIDQLHSSGIGIVLWIAAGGFAALCGSLWAWQRFAAAAQR